MKANEKKVIIILVIVSIVIIAGLIGVVQLNNKPKDNGESKSEIQQNEDKKVTEEGTIVHTSEKIKEDKQIKGFAISNASLKEKNGETILSARVTNNTNSAQKRFFGKIVLIDKENREIGRIPVNISETKAGEMIEIEATITESYENVYDFRLEK